MFSSPIIVNKEQQGDTSSGKSHVSSKTEQLQAPPQYVMTFNDFCAMYSAFIEKKDQVMMQVIFQIVYLNKK